MPSGRLAPIRPHLPLVAAAVILAMALAPPAVQAAEGCPECPGVEAGLEIKCYEGILTSVGRDDSDAMVLVGLDGVRYFSQFDVPLRMKNGAGRVVLDGNGRLESLLLANVSGKVVLYVAAAVDGLVVGLKTSGGQCYFERYFVGK